MRLIDAYALMNEIKNYFKRKIDQEAVLDPVDTCRDIFDIVSRLSFYSEVCISKTEKGE